MLAEDLFHDPGRRRYASKPEADALTEDHALQEAALVDLRYSALHNSVGLLFDLRGALQLRTADAAVLIARGPTRIDWDSASPHLPRVWHSVVSHRVGPIGHRFQLELGFAPDGGLTIEAVGAEFFVGDMDGVDGAPPDFIEDSEATIRAGMPAWWSRFVPTAATFLDPAT